MIDLILPTDDVTLHATLTPAVAPHGLALLAHGITAERHEGGVFTHLANVLAAQSRITSLRFDFRGHGASTGPSTIATVAGEVRDLKNACAELKRRGANLPVGIIAASFGAVAASHLLAEAPGDFAYAALLNPVLDTRRTFTEPELPWAQTSFTPGAVRASLLDGAPLAIHDRFTICADLVREMHDGPQPLELLQEVRLPMLVVHGDQDTCVSFDIAESFSHTNAHVEFQPIAGAEHGFGRPDEATAVAGIVANWIDAQRIAIDPSAKSVR